MHCMDFRLPMYGSILPKTGRYTMQKSVITHRSAGVWQRICPYLLVSFWVAGMALGCLFGHWEQEPLCRLIRQTVLIKPSLIGSCCAAILPVMLSCFVVSIGEPWLLLFISAFKAFSFSLCAWGVCLAFGQSSWLVLFLFLFSDICIIPVLYFFWLTALRNQDNSHLLDALFVFFALIVGLLDYLFVGPFLASILK